MKEKKKAKMGKAKKEGEKRREFRFYSILPDAINLVARVNHPIAADLCNYLVINH